MPPSDGLTRNTARWFLDIDGTISPFGLAGSWEGPTLYDGPPDSDLSIPYRREVIETIQRLHDSGLVQLTWLTTWDAEAVRAWTEAGLGPFRHVQRPLGRLGRPWKANAVKSWMEANPGDPVVWTDDDITEGLLRGFDRSRLLAIAPDPRVGLSDAQLSLIEGWLQDVQG